MFLLIDGYNLLHATDIFGKGTGPGGFQRTREALLSFLSTSLTEKERPQTTIVFDAADAPPGLPDRYVKEEINIRYARNYPDADTLLEELIEAHPSPRGLTVISSDHRVQRAARRRGAKPIDSDRWYAQLWQRRIEQRHTQQKAIPEKPVGQLSAAEIAYWVEQFDDDESPKLTEPTTPDPSGETGTDYDNPFPPGYADDLLGEDSWDDDAL